MQIEVDPGLALAGRKLVEDDVQAGAGSLAAPDGGERVRVAESEQQRVAAPAGGVIAALFEQLSGSGFDAQCALGFVRRGDDLAGRAEVAE